MHWLFVPRTYKIFPKVMIVSIWSLLECVCHLPSLWNDNCQLLRKVFLFFLVNVLPIKNHMVKPSVNINVSEIVRPEKHHLTVMKSTQFCLTHCTSIWACELKQMEYSHEKLSKNNTHIFSKKMSVIDVIKVRNFDVHSPDSCFSLFLIFGGTPSI